MRCVNSSFGCVIFGFLFSVVAFVRLKIVVIFECGNFKRLFLIGIEKQAWNFNLKRTIILSLNGLLMHCNILNEISGQLIAK